MRGDLWLWSLKKKEKQKVYNNDVDYQLSVNKHLTTQAVTVERVCVPVVYFLRAHYVVVFKLDLE